MFKSKILKYRKKLEFFSVDKIDTFLNQISQNIERSLEFFLWLKLVRRRREKKT